MFFVTIFSGSFQMASFTVSSFKLKSLEQAAGFDWGHEVYSRLLEGFDAFLRTDFSSHPRSRLQGSLTGLSSFCLLSFEIPFH
jgi:hypothetical protein